MMAGGAVQMRISVLMSVKNEAEHIESALRSIEPALHLGVEVVLVDDGSTDGTPDIVFGLGLPYVRIVRTEGIGKAAAFSLAYQHAQGEYFVLFAGDDLLQAETLEARIAPLQEHAGHGPCVTFCRLRSFSTQKKYDAMELPKKPHLGLESGGCMAFNRAFGDLAFPIPDMLANEDSWLMLHVRYLGVPSSHVPLVGLLYRIHENNSYKRGVPFSQVNEQMWMRQRAIFYFYEKYRQQMSAATQREVLVEFCLQLLRYLGLGASIVLVGRASLVLRIKMLFNASAPLYAIRERFYKFFSGW